MNQLNLNAFIYTSQDFHNEYSKNYRLKERVGIEYGEIFNGYFDRGDSLLISINGDALKYRSDRKARRLNYYFRDHLLPSSTIPSVLRNIYQKFNGHVCQSSENIYTVEVEEDINQIEKFYRESMSVFLNGQKIDPSTVRVNSIGRGLFFEIASLNESGVITIEAPNWGSSHKKGPLNDFHVVSCSDSRILAISSKTPKRYPRAFFSNFQFLTRSWPSLKPQGSLKVYARN